MFYFVLFFQVEGKLIAIEDHKRLLNKPIIEKFWISKYNHKLKYINTGNHIITKSCASYCPKCDLLYTHILLNLRINVYFYVNHRI